MVKKPRDVHVSKNAGGGWKVTQNGNKISTHQKQSNAIDRGKQQAKQDKVDLVVHGQDGKIKSKDSYGKDPIPPRDTER